MRKVTYDMFLFTGAITAIIGIAMIVAEETYIGAVYLGISIIVSLLFRATDEILHLLLVDVCTAS